MDTDVVKVGHDLGITWFLDNMPEEFVFTGFNRFILFIGLADEWYDCHYCGNATFHKPDKCEKCNARSFERRLKKGA